MASAMTEVAVRLAEPDRLAEQSVASVGPGSAVLVYPPVQALPGWQLPASAVEGASTRAQLVPPAPLASIPAMGIPTILRTVRLERPLPIVFRYGFTYNF